MMRRLDLVPQKRSGAAAPQRRTAPAEPLRAHEPEAAGPGHALADISIFSSDAGGPPAISRAPVMVQRTSLVEAAGEVAGRAVGEGGGLIVDDDAQTVTPGQMRMGEFFPQLRAAVCSTAEAELQQAGKSSEGCPFLDHWLAYYEARPAAHLERAIRKYAPDTAGASAAIDYLAPLTARLGRGIAHWARSGEMTDVPGELGGGLGIPGAGGPASSGAGASGGPPALGDAAIAPPGSPAAQLLLKSRPGTSGRAGADAGALASRLGPGRPLDGAQQARMESAFGMSFGQVRIHADDAGSQLSRDLDARAFTVGRHIAFGDGEYRPGEPAGDALLAHELAHVAQQGAPGPGVSGEPLPVSTPGGPLEREADAVAGDVIAQLHARETPPGAPRTRPSRRGGLQLQRCSKKPYKPSVAPEIDATAPALGKYVAEGMDRANYGNHVMFKEGIYYATTVYYWCQSNDPSKWDDDWWGGYADDDYWKRVGYNQWRLKSGVSAAEGIKAWLRGFTIAECNSTVHALELDAVRAAVGDKRFDERFGSPINDLDADQRLAIGANFGQANEFLKAPPGQGEGTIGDRPAEIGEWYYFTNHPKFLLKHPASDWQGENSIYMGRDAGGNQIWSGLGSEAPPTGSGNFHVKESEMYDLMVEAYNAQRGTLDNQELDRIKSANGGVLPPAYDAATPEPVGFPDTIDVNRLLNDPPYTLNGRTRKGGFNKAVGKTLDVDKIKALRDGAGP